MFKKIILILTICFTISCTSKFCPPYKVTGVHKVGGDCMLYLEDKEFRSFSTYYRLENCSYKIGDELK